ncbi:MAG: hypothetical protein K6G10_02790, partial [Butyrivibrio sp.]|nr:hypothetical protein [Butyrivibrio sp.]
MPEGRILVSKYNNTPVVTAFCDSDMEFLSFARNTGLQNIYVGKVDHIVKNIDSAFIRIKDDNISYLSTKKINPVCVLNRDFSKNSELKSGDELIVQVDTEALKTKKAKLSTSLKISGKYVVLTLGKNGVGVSLKISDD